jgi:hypothetical protein
MGGVHKATEINRSIITGNLNDDQADTRTPPGNATPVDEESLTSTRQIVVDLFRTMKA